MVKCLEQIPDIKGYSGTNTVRHLILAGLETID